MPTNGEPAVTEGDPTTVTPTGKKKPRMRVKGEKKVKGKIKTEKMEEAEVGEVPLTLPAPSTSLDVHSDLLTHRDDDGVPDFPLPE